MKYKLHIPFVNRPDLLSDAVESLRDIGNIHVWADGVPLPHVRDVMLHELPQMPFTAVMNTVAKCSRDDDVMFFAHNDCLAKPGIAKQFLKFVEGKFSGEEKWGIVFTTYDVLCCFNMAAVKDAGSWDTQFYQYTSDVDYYRRINLAGWPNWYMPTDGVIHRNDASNTIKADPIFDHVTQFRTKFDKDYYVMKWGGPPGEEKFKRPFQDLKL